MSAVIRSMAISTLPSMYLGILPVLVENERSLKKPRLNDEGDDLVLSGFQPCKMLISKFLMSDQVSLFGTFSISSGGSENSLTYSHLRRKPKKLYQVCI